MGGYHSLITDVHDFLPDTPWDAGKEASFETPVGEIGEGLIMGCIMGEHIAEEVLGEKIGLHAAKFTAEEVVRLLKGGRGSALRALVVNKDSKTWSHFVSV